MDEERLRNERTNRGQWKSRVTGLDDMGIGYSPSEQPRQNRRQMRPQREDEDDLEYRLAIEASKHEAEEDAARRSRNAGPDTDDDLEKAIKLSKEEEELRQRELENQNQGDLLFDDTPTTEQVPQPTGFNQGYQQQPQVDWFGNPVQQQQPQQTGFLNNAYSQPTGGFQNGYGGGFGYNQPQQTGFNQPQQTGFEQMQQPAQQFIQPQNTFNPWATQMQPNGFGTQPQQQEQQPTAQPGSNNPWAGSNSTASPIGAQPTGSNNPFATHRPQQTSSFSRAPTLSTLAEQQATSDFSKRPNPITAFSTPAPSHAPVSTPSPTPQQQRMSPLSNQQQAPQDPYQAKLNALLASGEGQDTFGNVGDLRIPAQHTAPGTFVNSAGAGSMGRLEASRTGNNPFFSQQPGQQFPAQTGPASNLGFGGSPNPFGQQQQPSPFGQQPQYGQQQYGQQGQQQQGGSLIDL
jgi:epsin